VCLPPGLLLSSLAISWAACMRMLPAHSTASAHLRHHFLVALRLANLHYTNVINNNNNNNRYLFLKVYLHMYWTVDIISIKDDHVVSFIIRRDIVLRFSWIEIYTNVNCYLMCCMLQLLIVDVVACWQSGAVVPTESLACSPSLLRRLRVMWIPYVVWDGRVEVNTAAVQPPCWVAWCLQSQTGTSLIAAVLKHQLCCLVIVYTLTCSECRLCLLYIADTAYFCIRKLNLVHFFVQ